MIPAPFVAGGTRLFRGSQQVTLGSAEPKATIHYTRDGSEPTRASARYTGPVNVDATLTLRVRAFLDADASPVLAVSFRRLSDYPKITLSAPYAPQYAAAGDDTLVDGLTRMGWKVEAPKGTMFVWAPIPDPYAEMGSLDFSFHLLEEARVAVSPGVGFGDEGEGFVRFALVENEHRISQATRSLRRALDRL